MRSALTHDNLGNAAREARTMSAYDDLNKLRNGYPISLRPEFDTRLQAYVAETDATIKKLSDALAYSGCHNDTVGWHTWSCHHTRQPGACLQECIEVQAALRHVGRLP